MGGTQAISFVTGIVLARLLQPEDFGLIAASLLFLEVSTTLIASSVVQTLVRQEQITPLDLSTGFVTQLVAAVATLAVLTSLAPLAVELFDDERMLLVLPALGLTLLLLPFRGNPTIIARRNLEFRVLAMATFVEVISFALLAITFALLDWAVWSLVWGRVGSRMATVAYLWHVTRWQPSLAFSGASFRRMISTSTQFAGKDTLEALSANTGYFLVGSRLGVESLGYYSRAHYLMNLLIAKIDTSVDNVLFPVFSRIQNDMPALRRTMLKGTCIVAIVIFPMFAGLALVAEPFILTVYGTNWAFSVDPLKILCFAGLFYALDPPAVVLFNAKGYLMQDMKRKIVHLVVLVAGVTWGANWGIIGASVAVTATAAVYWLLLVAMLQRHAEVHVRQYLAVIVPTIAACFVMGAAVLSMQVLLEASSQAIVLLSSVATGAGVYSLTLLAIRHYLPGFELYKESQDELLFAVQRARQ